MCRQRGGDDGNGILDTCCETHNVSDPVFRDDAAISSWNCSISAFEKKSVA
jgi:hypothetical protein